MDPIHYTRGIYFGNCYWCAMVDTNRCIYDMEIVVYGILL
jgi:hypothetical protein